MEKASAAGKSLQDSGTMDRQSVGTANDKQAESLFLTGRLAFPSFCQYGNNCEVTIRYDSNIFMSHQSEDYISQSWRLSRK